MTPADESARVHNPAEPQAAPVRRTPRQVAREENLARIRSIALDQMARDGAAGLSLRAVAREMGLVSSAMYRYYPSRDDLVTDLVLDAYRELAEAIEAAGAASEGASDGAAAAWLDGSLALRRWALAEPHRYALLYGSPIPGYAAPPTTVAPAVRVVRALVRPALLDAEVSLPRTETWPEALAGQLDDARRGLGVDDSIPTSRIFALFGAVARVHGLVTLELNGQFVGAFEPAEHLFAVSVKEEAHRLGLH